MLPKRQGALDVRSTYYIVTLSCGCAAANAGTAFDAAWNARFHQRWWTNSASRSHVLPRPPSASGTDILQLRRTARCISFLWEEVTPRFTWIPNTGPIALPRSLSTSHATALTFLGRKPTSPRCCKGGHTHRHSSSRVHHDSMHGSQVGSQLGAVQKARRCRTARRQAIVTCHSTSGGTTDILPQDPASVTPVQWQEREANQLPETGEMTSTTPRRHRGISLGFDHVS